MKKILALVLALVLCLCAALACAETVKVKVGVVGENNEQWEQVIIPTLAKEGIEIELVKFSDYIMPNLALADGDVDLNAFQHYNFMNNWSAENGTELVAICDTLIAPLCIYSEKYTSIDEVKEGDGIAIMNDVVNEARALRMLEATGLIKLADDITELATVADIVENPKNLQFFEMEAALTASMMSDPSVHIAFLNGTPTCTASSTSSPPAPTAPTIPSSPASPRRITPTKSAPCLIPSTPACISRPGSNLRRSQRNMARPQSICSAAFLRALQARAQSRGARFLRRQAYRINKTTYI